MSDQSDEKIVVEIFGRNYTFASEGEETGEREIRAAAQLVNERVSQIVQGERHRPALSTAVLAGLTLADELIELRADYDAAKRNISKRTARLSLGNLGERSAGELTLGSRIDSLDEVESRED